LAQDQTLASGEVFRELIKEFLSSIDVSNLDAQYNYLVHPNHKASFTEFLGLFKKYAHRVAAQSQ
jgi:hypothetical protein